MADESRDPQKHSFLLERPSFWANLRNNFKELVSPDPEPDLQLESKPIPVKSIWSESRPLKSRLSAVAIHLAVIGILLLPFWRPVRVQVKKAMQETMLYVPAAPPTAAPPAAMPRMRKLSGGGMPVVQPKLKLIQAPKIQPVESPTALTPMTEMNLPSLGSIGPISGPPGIGGGHSGAGPGGAGAGSGSPNGNCIGSNCADDAAIAQAPVVIFDPDPPYTDAARKAKFQGTCVLQVLIGADGHVKTAKVVQALGLGLDQNAVTTVLTWRFVPAKDKYGHPVAALATIDVNFRLL